MKHIKITETDLEFRKGLAQILISDGAIPIIFEVDDSFDLDSYEGLGLFNNQANTENFTSKFPEVAAWLEAYTGNFNFYLSLKSQLKAKGMLSEKQIQCVQRAIEKDHSAGIKTPEGKPQEFSLKPGETLVLSKFISSKIAQQAGHTRAHRAVDVIEVEAETEKAYRAKVRLSARKTTHCGICGLYLENPASIVAGIGPICAENNGIPYGENSLAELNASLCTTVEVLTWIPKKSIKERIPPISSVMTEEDEESERVNAIREDLQTYGL